MLSKITTHVALLLLSLCIPIDGGRYPLRILGLFPHPGVSHFHFFHPVMRGLAEAGHEVTVISHFPDKSPPVRYKDLPLTGYGTLTNTVDLKLLENRHFYDHFIEFFLLNEWGKQSCNATLKSDALAHLLQKKATFDVILVEQFNTDCMLGIAHHFKAPIIGLSSSAMMPWYYERMGAPIIPSYIPCLFVGQSEEMNFMQRLGNWISFHALNLMYNWISVPAADAMVRYKFGHDVPSVSELGKEMSLFFVNQHYSLAGVKPLPPSVIELGGIHIQKAKPLDADIQRILDNAEHGVIVFSWGSMVKADTMPDHKRDGILKAFKRLKQKVIWKWENETIPNKPDNVYIRKWLPQRDILCHPNVKVFMTHGGLMGSSEAAYCGVPVVATPMYGDQFLNAAALEQRGMGIVLKYEDFSESSVFRTLKKVLEKPYMDKAKAVSYSYNHRPQTALQQAIKWVEYVVKTDGAPLTKSKAVYMDRIAYYSLDVYLVIISVVSIAVYFWILLIRKCCGSKKTRVEKLKKH